MTEPVAHEARDDRGVARTTLDARVDHLVLATPDLERGMQHVEELLGVRPAIGGRHVGRGTWNGLLALGADVYLEIIAPDPQQGDLPAPRLFGLDRVTEARLVRWAARTHDLDAVRARAVRGEVELGEIKDGSRQRADGVTLSWRYTDPATVTADGLVPFFIDWKQSPHPALTAPQGARLVELRAEHPDPVWVERQLRALEIRMSVTRAPATALVAIIDGARGRIELR